MYGRSSLWITPDEVKENTMIKYLYHITHASRIISIAQHGLLPGMNPNIGTNESRKQNLIWLTPYPSHIILSQGLRYPGLHYILRVDISDIDVCEYGFYLWKKRGLDIEFVTKQHIHPGKISVHKTYFFTKSVDGF